MTAEEKQAKVAALRAEADALERAEAVEYPKWVHVEGHEAYLVNSAEEEAAYVKSLKKAKPEPAAEPKEEAAEPADDEKDEHKKAAHKTGHKK